MHLINWLVGVALRGFFRCQAEWFITDIRLQGPSCISRAGRSKKSLWRRKRRFRTILLNFEKYVKEKMQSEAIKNQGRQIFFKNRPVKQENT